MDYYKEHNLKEIGEVITGKTPPTKIKEYYADVGAPFYTPSDYKDDHKYLKNTARKVSHKALQKFDNYIIPPKSIMVTCIGSDMGKVVLNDEDGMTNQQINSLIVDKKEFSTDYIYYALKRLYPQLRKLGEGSGSTMPIINKTNFSNISLSLPPLPEQKRIANILSSFDNKIELLREQNKTLENIAQTIFKQWFIDFNFPDSNGKPYKDNGGKMVDSELGMIPEGWKVGSFYELCDIDYGYPFNSKKFSPIEGFPLIRIRDLQNSSTETYTTESFEKKYIISPGDILVGMDGDFIITRWLGEEGLLNQRVCRLNPKGENITKSFLRLVAEPYIKLLQRTNYGTTVAHLGKSDWDRFQIIIPPEDNIKKIRTVIEPLENKIILNSKELRILIENKNLLLNYLIK